MHATDYEQHGNENVLLSYIEEQHTLFHLVAAFHCQYNNTDHNAMPVLDTWQIINYFENIFTRKLLCVVWNGMRRERRDVWRGKKEKRIEDGKWR